MSARDEEIGMLYDAEDAPLRDPGHRGPRQGARERALDPRKCMFHNLKAFKAASWEQIERTAYTSRCEEDPLPRGTEVVVLDGEPPRRSTTRSRTLARPV